MEPITTRRVPTRGWLNKRYCHVQPCFQVCVSPAFERISGYSADELLGKSFIALVHPDDLERAVQDFARLVEYPEESVVMEVRRGSW